MFFRYGDFTHPAGEVNLTRFNIRGLFGPRGQRLKTVYTMFLDGEICADGPAAITTRIAELVEVYSHNYRDAGLYLDDGTLTPHHLQSNRFDCISGVKVIQRSWPEGGPTEYATGRKYSITLEAEFDDADSQVVEWQEQVAVVGNCGPRIEVVEVSQGPPLLQLLNQRTAQRIIQSGSSIGYEGYVESFGPLYPTFEHVDQQLIRRGTPKAQGRGYRFFPLQWTYYHSLAIPQTPLPTIR